MATAEKAVPASRIQLDRQVLLFGRRAAGARLAAEIQEMQVRSVAVVSSASAAAAGVLEQIRSTALGSVREQIAVSAVPRGAPLEFIAGLEESLASADVDAVVAVGGGSVIDACKAAVFRLSGGQLPLQSGQSQRHALTDLPLIVVPTTLSGAEATPSMGITIDGAKHVIRDSRVAPTVAASDPEVLALTPPSLLFRTSMEALAHCVESLYSPEANPLSTAMALFAADRLGPVLNRGSSARLRVAELDRLGTASLLGGLAMGRIRSCLEHAVCQVLGRFGLTHADAHCVMLPHVLRFNFPATADVQHQLAAALASGRRSAELPDLVDRIGKSLGLPSRLRDLSLSRKVLDEVAQAVAEHRGSVSNPIPIRSAAEVMPLLESAW